MKLFYEDTLYKYRKIKCMNNKHLISNYDF